jgi:hypothetical protein
MAGIPSCSVAVDTNSVRWVSHYRNPLTHHLSSQQGRFDLFRNPTGRIAPQILTMTFHRTLLVLSRGPLAGHNRRAGVIVSKTVSSLAPSRLSSSVQGMSISMKTLENWPTDEASLSPARAKLQHVLEEYRQNKYVQHVYYMYNPTVPSCSCSPPFAPSPPPSRFVCSHAHLSLLVCTQFQSDALFSLCQGNDPRDGREPRRLY